MVAVCGFDVNMSFKQYVRAMDDYAATNTGRLVWSNACLSDSPPEMCHSRMGSVLHETVYCIMQLLDTRKTYRPMSLMSFNTNSSEMSMDVSAFEVF